jgi:pimeloyl-ACP methyl ester carboxylesterase
MPVQGAYIDPRLANTDPETFASKYMGKANSFSEVSAEVRKTDPAAMNQLATELARYNFMNEIANCPCPLLMVNGAQDSVIQPPQNEKQYLESMGGNRSIVELDGSDYFPMLQEKAKFNRLLLDFTSASDDNQGQIAPKEYWQRRVR